MAFSESSFCDWIIFNASAVVGIFNVAPTLDVESACCGGDASSGPEYVVVCERLPHKRPQYAMATTSRTSFVLSMIRTCAKPHRKSEL